MNLLQYETSPYLLQHAHNPVHWQAWGKKPFEQAAKENKPVLLSIGYSTCHWCHVMEHESFCNQDIADIMNEHYICIKLDREEYPDIDRFYMDALQAMTGSGGWPLNIFLTPDKKPFYGGTYFPPIKMYNRASWKEVLLNVSHYYKNNHENVQLQANQLFTHLQNSAFEKKINTHQEIAISELDFDKIANRILEQADTTHGGIGTAPKFPATFVLEYLLNYHIVSNNKDALSQVKLSLQKMYMGGIYDHIDGGFARYSTDKYWIAPHFEKMIYDNALLVILYAKTYKYTKENKYLEIAEEILQWALLNMTNTYGAFYTAIDADSEGVEGKFYTWTFQELKDILQEDFDIFSKIYNVQEEGNWEHTNILYQTTWEIDKDSIDIINKCKAKLHSIREKRIKPLRDEKVLMSNNALMIQALCEVYSITSNEKYLHAAICTANFIENNLKNSESDYLHTFINNEAKIPAYADDLAFLAKAYILLYNCTTKDNYILLSEDILQKLFQYFHAEGNQYFAYTDKRYETIAVNKSELYDGATPSSNAIICECLIYLGYRLQKIDWYLHAHQMLENMKEIILQYPTSFAKWANTLFLHQNFSMQISIYQPDAHKVWLHLYNQYFYPNYIYIIHPKDSNNKYILCKNNNCLPPFTSIEALITAINKKNFAE